MCQPCRSLGENGDWRKFSLTELGTKVPLLIAAPWLPHTHGQHTDAIVELVDVFPTVSALAGLPLPSVQPDEPALDGQSLVPLFSQTSTQELNKTYALSQYPRCPVNISQMWADNWCIEIPASEFGWMGFSLRSAHYRYNAWFRWNRTSEAPVLTESPSNNSGGFYNELFSYDQEQDFNALDLHEIAAENPRLVRTFHSKLLSLIRQ